MKIIDLLNKIANGEELPKKIKYDDKIYYMVGNNDYENYEYEETPTLLFAVGATSYINEEIEILDEEEDKKEDKKIEKLGHWVDVKTWVKGNDLETGLGEQSDFNKNVFYKINEIIDYINRGDKNV